MARWTHVCLAPRASTPHLRLDFMVCNFLKVFGENPWGFADLFMKKASLGALEHCAMK
jgi:hypothetical protein